MNVNDLLELVDKLRKKCPWDREQTLDSLKNNFIEEAYELIEAIENNNISAIKEELGDMLFLGFFLAKILEEEKAVSLNDVLTSVVKKYKKKHPHVFGKKILGDQDAVLKYWQKSKQDIFNGIPKMLPALMAAKIIQDRARKLGFDWNTPTGPLEKIDEEVSEMKKSMATGQVFEELGDVLFACVNLARHLSVDPEDALRFANKKFIRRFRKIMDELKRRGKNIEEVDLKEMDALWNEIKKQGE